MRLRRHLNFANVCSFLALFIALGTGGAWAASKLDGKLIKPGTVRAKQLATGAVTSSKVRNGSLLSKDFKKGQLPAGPAGAKGEQGPAGASTPQTIGDGSIGADQLAPMPAFIAHAPSSTPVAASTNVPMPLTGEDLKRGIDHSTTTTPDRVTVTRAGLYAVTATAEFSGGSVTGTNAEMRRAALQDCDHVGLLYADGVTRTVVGAGTDAVNIAAVVNLAQGACIHVVLRSGQAVTMGANGDLISGLQMTYLGR